MLCNKVVLKYRKGHLLKGVFEFEGKLCREHDMVTDPLTDNAKGKLVGLLHECFVGGTRTFRQVSKGSEMEKSACIAKAAILPNSTKIRAKH
jgi:hypothetical protein